jgi:hypothetical protein
MKTNRQSKRRLLVLWAAVCLFGALVGAYAGDKWTVQIRNQTISA